MSTKYLIACFSILLLILTSPAPAGESSPKIRPVGFVDLDTGSLFALDLNLAFGDHFTGFVPGFYLQGGNERYAVGLNWGFSWADADNVDSDVYPGAFALTVKTKNCVDGVYRTCYGLQAELGIAPFDFENSGERVSALVGLMTQQMRPSRFAKDIITIEPLFAVNVQGDQFFAQAVIGPSLWIDFAQDEADDSMEAGLLWGFEGGALVNNQFSAHLGIKALSSLTLDNNETFMAMDLGLRMYLHELCYRLGFSIPLSGDVYEDALDLVLTLGINAEF